MTDRTSCLKQEWNLLCESEKSYWRSSGFSVNCVFFKKKEQTAAIFRSCWTLTWQSFDCLLIFLMFPIPLFSFRTEHNKSEGWRKRPSSVSRSQRCHHHTVGVDPIRSIVRGLRLLLPWRTLIWKLPTSIFCGPSGAEKSRAEGRRCFCDREECHQQRHRKISMLCVREQIKST